MKKRTKFTILSIIMIVLFGAYMVLCSVLSWSFPPDSFIVGWFSAWCFELALLYGIKIKSKE